MRGRDWIQLCVRKHLRQSLVKVSHCKLEIITLFVLRYLFSKYINDVIEIDGFCISLFILARRC